MTDKQPVSNPQMSCLRFRRLVNCCLHTRMLNVVQQYAQVCRIQRLVFGLCWTLLHLVVSAVHLGIHMIHSLESYVISILQLHRLRPLQLDKLRYLALVVDSDDSICISRVLKLLRWLGAIGIRHVSLYDPEGVLKKNRQRFLTDLENSRLYTGSAESDACASQNQLVLEFLSISSGKEASAKAASFLCSQHLKAGGSCENLKYPIFTEIDMDNALKEVGCWGPEPDLLLIYGPVRCHLGFPPWRLKYTEIVHMGPLKSMRFGSLIKAVYRFTQVHQNYGT